MFRPRKLLEYPAKIAVIMKNCRANRSHHDHGIMIAVEDWRGVGRFDRG
jgi:hypothetical protein